MATPIATSYPAWETDLLSQLNIAPNPVNLQFLNLWAQSEGMAATTNNPLAITDPSNSYPHSGVVAPNGGDPVYAFPSAAVGSQATAAFLKAGYGNVIAAMQGTNLGSMWQAVNSSGWCKGCQGGKYPTAVYSALNGNAPTSIFQGGGTGNGVQQTPQGSSSNGGCSSAGGISFLGSSLGIGTGCQLKALTGGLLIGLGASVLLVGGALIAAYGISATKVGKAATGALATAPGPWGAAGKVATAAGSSSEAGRAVGSLPSTRAANREAAANAAKAQAALEQDAEDRELARRAAASGEANRRSYERQMRSRTHEGATGGRPRSTASVAGHRAERGKHARAEEPF